jgi:hypothetical protein
MVILPQLQNLANLSRLPSLLLPSRHTTPSSSSHLFQLFAHGGGCAGMEGYDDGSTPGVANRSRVFSSVSRLLGFPHTWRAGYHFLKLSPSRLPIQL